MPASSRKLLLAFGGLLALVVLAVGAVGAWVYSVAQGTPNINHLKPIHTGGTLSITTRREPARELAVNPDRRWPQDWKSGGHEPGAN